MADKLVLIEKALNGWHGSGYDTKNGKDTFSCGFRSLENALERAEDGTVVLDKSVIDQGTIIKWVMSGPMFGPTLPRDGVDKFTKDDRERLAEMLPGLQDGFYTLAKAALDNENWSSLDKVGLDIFVDLWRNLGAKVGVVKNNQVEWEDEE